MAGTSYDLGGVIGEVDTMYDLLQEESEASQRLRRPTPIVQTALRKSGVFGIFMPQSLGGFGASASEIFDVIERISYADGSVGWIVRVVSSETARAISRICAGGDYGPSAWSSMPLVAGRSTVLSGQARRDGEDFIVSGRIRFAPGIAIASHVDIAVKVGGTGEEIVCVIPRSELDVSEGPEMLGLRATGTLDCRARDVVVPAAMTFPMASHEGDLRDALVNSVDVRLIAAMNHAAWSLGVGRRIMHEVCNLARESDPGSSLNLDEFYSGVACLSARLRGSRASLDIVWENMSTSSVGSDLGSLESDMRLFAVDAAGTCSKIAQFAHRFAGATMLQSGALQRFFRDALAGAQHQASSPQVLRSCGEEIVYAK